MDSAMRASDGERERVAARVVAAAGEGRLTLAESEERLAAVYAMRFRHELVGLTEDLPVPQGRVDGERPGGPDPACRAWQGTVRRGGPGVVGRAWRGRVGPGWPGPPRVLVFVLIAMAVAGVASGGPPVFAPVLWVLAGLVIAGRARRRASIR